MKLLHLLLVLTGCGRAPVPLILPGLDSTYAQMAEELHHVSEGHVAGWPSDTGCDGALWAGEARAAGASWVDISAALASDGRPTRRPHADCGPAGTPDAPPVGNSEATTSTDMHIGSIVGLMSAHDVTSLTRLQQYTDAHSGVVGTPASDLPLVYMKPGTRSLLARALDAVGGPGDVAWAAYPLQPTPPSSDSDTHLSLLLLVAKTRMGGLDPIDVVVAHDILARNPHDALAHWVAGDVAGALALVESGVIPSYVRDDASYPLVYRLFVLHLIMGKFG